MFKKKKKKKNLFHFFAISVKIQNYQIAPYMKLKKDIEIILPYFCFVFGTRSLKNDIQN